MCGRYNFTRVPGDEKMEAIHLAMEKNYPGAYKTGEIFPGDTVPAVLDRGGARKRRRRKKPLPTVSGSGG